jgi:hypothetical protein
LKKIIRITAGLILLTSFAVIGQETKDVKTCNAGFKSLKLVDKSRTYKANTPESDSLHYRPVDLDIWYPSLAIGNTQLTFGDLFRLFEQRANQYQDTDYTGITDELAQFFAMELGLQVNDGQKLLHYETNSYANTAPTKEISPLIIYMAGFNGMGFENFKILERLAERGFIVVSVWSVGRYPGNMTNHKLDMIEQVYDAEFAINYLKLQNELKGFKSYYDKLLLSLDISTKPFDKGHKNTTYSSVQGKIVDFKTGVPLAYVNIGISNQEIGTVSNEEGSYEFRITPEMENDTVKISMIGYKAQTFIVRELLAQQRHELKLAEETNQLTEVVITAQGLKKKNLGNKTTSKFVSTGFSYNQLGAEMGIKVNVKEQPAFVDAFHFNISYNRLSAKALFRLNIYEIERGRPSKNIMTENIIIPINPKQTGLISVDLMPHNIVLREDVIVTLEWVKNEGENNKGEGIFFSLGFFNSGTLIKQSSQGRFKKFSNMGVGMNFDVRY